MVERIKDFLKQQVTFNKIAGKGATVDGIRFLLPSSKAKDIVAWVGTELPSVGNYTQANLEVKPVDVSDVVLDGYTEVAFSKSYEIPEGGLWVGYSFVVTGVPEEPEEPLDASDDEYIEWYYTVYMPWVNANADDAYPFMVSYLDEPAEGAFLYASKVYDDLCRKFAELDPANADYYLSLVGWFDYSDNYAAALNVLIGGGKFMNNAVSVSEENIGLKYAKVNDKITFPVKMLNSGKNGITDFTYEVAFNGQKVSEENLVFDEPVEKFLANKTVLLTIPTGDKTGVQDLTLTITKVNGQPNEIDAVAKGTLIVLADTPQKMPLVEEFTGTWCGWCSRGWVAMEKLTEDYKDKAVI